MIMQWQCGVNQSKMIISNATIWTQSGLLASKGILTSTGSINYTIIIMPLYIAVGKPISVPKTPQPTQEEIDSTHEAYVQALKELYEEYNPVYGDPKVPLHFIWIVTKS